MPAEGRPAGGDAAGVPKTRLLNESVNGSARGVLALPTRAAGKTLATRPSSCTWGLRRGRGRTHEATHAGLLSSANELSVPRERDHARTAPRPRSCWTAELYSGHVGHGVLTGRGWSRSDLVSMETATLPGLRCCFQKFRGCSADDGCSHLVSLHQTRDAHVTS